MILLCFCFILNISCTHHNNHEPFRSSAKNQLQNTIDYDSCKRAITVIKKQYRRAWQQLSKQSKEKIFTDAVVQTIVPAWMGTDWNFNGTTRIPQQGSIACGYFVTTVLQDAGLELARIKLAQCASEEMISTLVQPAGIRRFSNTPMTEFLNAVSAGGYGIYIIGLDNHTGFLYNDGEDTWFIHASYAGSRKITREKAAESNILGSSRYKVLGKLSADDKVLSRWIN